MKFKQKVALSFIRAKFKVVGAFSKRKAAEQAFRLFCTPQGRSIATKVPKNAEEINFDMDGHNIYGYRWNHPQEHKILLLHGFSSAAHKFERYVSPLVKKGYEVLAFDALAHGKSEGKLTNALEYSNMIKKVVELYGPIQGFLAHSFGGIALSLALEDIPHNDQTKIVFIAPATETSSAIDSAFALLDINDKIVRKRMEDIIYEKSGKDVSWFSMRRAVKNIKANILWFHDEDDDITPLKDALKVKKDNHSHINFVITKGLGHRRIYHDPAVKKAACDFL